MFKNKNLKKIIFKHISYYFFCLPAFSIQYWCSFSDSCEQEKLLLGGKKPAPKGNKGVKRNHKTRVQAWNQPSPARQGEEVSEAVAPKGNPNQFLLPNFHGCELKHGRIRSDEENWYSSTSGCCRCHKPSARGRIKCIAKREREDRHS